MNSDNNGFKNWIKKLWKQGGYYITKDKININVLKHIVNEINDDLKLGNRNIKSITENWFRLSNSQEAFKYTKKKKCHKPELWKAA